MLSFFPRGVLDEILSLIESVSFLLFQPSNLEKAIVRELTRVRNAGVQIA